MTEWREFKLGDICTIIQYGYTESATFDPVGPKFLRITDIVPNIIDWSTVPYCKIDKENYEKYKLDVGDIVIARTGATTGYNKRIKDSINAVFASYLIRFKINKEIADDCFISYVLKSDSYFGFIDNAVGGSAQPGINARVLSQFSFLLPPLPEQKAIAEVLSSLDDKIDLLTRQNKTLEDLAQAYFRKWFIEDASDKWEEIPLGQLFVISSGKGLKKEKFTEHGQYRVLGANGEIGKTNEYLFNERLIYTGRVGTLGNVFIVDREPVWLSDNTLVFRNIKYFFFVYFSLKWANLADYNVGSTQPLIRQSDIKEIRVFMPDKERLDSFENLANSIFAKINSNQKQIQLLQKLRDTLLPKLISGEIRVKM